MINVAVAGAGLWGSNLIRLFNNDVTSKVKWVVDRDPEKLKRVTTFFPNVHATTDWDQAISDQDVVGAVVATPPSSHYSLAEHALKNGKHVLVEKPLTTSSSDAEALCLLAEGSNRLLMVGHTFLYNAGIRRAKKYVSDGTLGAIHYIAMVRTNLGRFQADANVAWDLAAHDVSIANYWLGSTPSTVSAVGLSLVNPGVEDVAFITFRYPEGELVNSHVSWLHPLKTREATIVGESQMLTWDDMDIRAPVRLYDKGVSGDTPQADPGLVDSMSWFRSSVREGDVIIPRIELDEPLKVECEHFLACVSNGQEPRTPGRDGLTVVRVLEAVQRSMAQGGREEGVEAGPI